MKYLIDTHTFLWYSEGIDKISNLAKETIDNSDNIIIVSIASLWEISIKVANKKLEVANSFESIFDDIINFEFEILPLQFPHLVIQKNLSFYHRDPFDRVLISQAISEKIDIISIDAIIDEYLVGTSVKRIW